MIWETCKTYLWQQGKFLVLLWALIAACIVYYFYFLQDKTIASVLVILASSVLGILGSYGVAWFGIRINTYANSRAAFASLRGNSLQTLMIPLRSGMSIGLLLVCVELVCMIGILLFMPRDLAGPCFIGFAIGESLGAAALRIGGGIFTKIADIGSDLMKIVFNLPEDDPKNPGVIADCTGDNAGDSVGPTADGFETYGVTGVALIAFLALSLGGAIETQGICGQLIVWIFAIQSLMVLASLGSFYVNKAVSNSLYDNKKDFNWEQPLTNLVWLTSIVSIVVAFVASKFLLGGVARTRRACRSKPVVGAGRHRFLRHAGRAAHHGIHQNLRQHQVPAREGNRHLLRPGRRVAEHSVRLRHRQFLRVLDGTGHHRADVRRLRVLAKPGPARAHAGAIQVRRAHLRLRPRRLRLPGHGAGHHRRGQLRPGHRQRPVHL